MTENKELQEECALISGDFQTWYKDYTSFKEANTIIREYHSSQMINLPNPEYGKIVTKDTPQFIQTIIVNSIIFSFKKVPEKVTKINNEEIVIVPAGGNNWDKKEE